MKPLWFALLLTLVCATAKAQLELDQLPPELDLTPHVEVFEDASRALRLKEVAATPFHRVDELSYGFSYSALWMRFSARNGGTQPVYWLLELEEPSLDSVFLYVRHQDGHWEQHRGGDEVAYNDREIGDARTVFELRADPGDDAVYYLRVRSDDVLRAQVRAWQPAAYAAHRERETVAWWLFYGALVMLAVQNLGVFAMVRQTEHLFYALAAMTMCLVLLGLNGQQAELLFPSSPLLCARLPSLAMAVATLLVMLFMDAVLSRLAHRKQIEHYFRLAVWCAASLTAFCLVAPVGLSFRVLASVFLSVGLAGPVLLYLLGSYPLPEIHLYRRSWIALCIALPISVLRYAGVLPAWRGLVWVLPIGFVAHGVITSLALASLAGSMRRALSKMNDQLRANVDELREALTAAQQSNEAAQRAAKAKDEFVATMSHELRTPLNAIINIPQGLIAEFVAVRSAKCSHCEASYLLDDELIGADTECEDCHQRGTLVESRKLRHRGDGARYLRFLQKIERAGQHLLQMINGVLDFGKLEVGRAELALGPVDLDALIREVTDQMVDLAQRKNIQLELAYTQADRRLLMADGLRLKQVLINLLANAIKFSEAGSVVTIRWNALADGELIEVEDRGIGIAPADHERVFTSFEQAGEGRKYGGTGLGLSISRSLVRMHGGELSVRSELGQGSTFVERLPLARAERPDNTNEFMLDSKPRVSTQ